MTRRDWDQPDLLCLGAFLNGDEIRRPSSQGEPVRDDSFVVLLNGRGETLSFVLPPRRFGRAWSLVLDTADPGAEDGARRYPARAAVALESRSVVLLQRA